MEDNQNQEDLKKSSRCTSTNENYLVDETYMLALF